MLKARMMIFAGVVVVLCCPAFVSAHVNIQYPLGGESFAAGDSIEIEWAIAIDHGPCDWDIYFSSDAGVSWDVLVENLPKAQLTHSWTIPEISTTQGRIKIVQDNATGTDYESQSSDFSINTVLYDVLIDAGDFFFDPRVVHIGIGQTIRWQNISGSIVHTTTADGGLWDSGDLGPGDFYEFTFNAEGVYDYVCTYHAGSMTGTIVVGTPDSVAAEIQIISFSFQPQNTNLQLGDYLRWINFDNVSHTSTSDDALWDSGTLTTGEYFIMRVDSAGDFGYFCSFHPGMQGTLMVADTVSGDLYEYFPGDANMYNGQWPPQVIGGDVTYLVNYFRGSESNPPCNISGFYSSADANGDCTVIGSDVTRMVNYFRGNTGISYCSDFDPAWLTPDDVPAEAPSGWPNCE